MGGKRTFSMPMLPHMDRSQLAQAVALALLLCGCGAAPTAVDDQPAPTRMKRSPTPGETTRCQPLVTEIPDGSARLRCQVGAEGRLERCVVLSTTNARLGEWGLCMAAGFLADEAQVGQEVELPLKWRRPS